METIHKKAIELSNDGIIYDSSGKQHTINYVTIEYVKGVANKIMLETNEGKYFNYEEVYLSVKDIPEYIKHFEKYRIELVAKYGRHTKDLEMIDIFRTGFEEGQKTKLICNAQEQLQK